jgi:alpha-amylase
MARLDVPNFISWADAERDLTAWRGNDLQDDAMESIARLEAGVKRTGDEGLLRTWRRLTTSDHFYYMCTKFFSDGEVHKYFNPYDTPYEAFINYMNVISDFQIRLDEKRAALDVKETAQKELAAPSKPVRKKPAAKKKK